MNIRGRGLMKYTFYKFHFSYIFFCIIWAHPAIECKKTEQFNTESLVSYVSTSTEQTIPHRKVQRKAEKEWTFLTYMAADNDLAPFARKNLKQQADVGSTPYINIVTQLDTRTVGNKKITKRYYVEKNKLIVANDKDPATQKMDSGIPSTLIDFCKWAIELYPAKNYALVLWNHGTGALDIGPKRSINPFPLFLFNPDTNLVELDRSIPFSEFVLSSYLFDPRGICFDDSTGHYLNNQDLELALATICSTYLKQKFSIICFDACLMSMIEIASIVKKYAHFMTASQEVELGTGYDYYKILSPFEKQSLPKDIFARHIVEAYGKAYSTITHDYTQSALNLSLIDALEKNVSEVAQLLTHCLRAQKGKSVTEALKASRHKLFCTHFDEPSYIDLYHFYTNLLSYMKQFSFKSSTDSTHLVSKLRELVSEGLELVSKTVTANSVGKNLSRAHGISIYFPERKLHQVYYHTSFAKSNPWAGFLATYVNHQP